jgi:hypothetical protein
MRRIRVFVLLFLAAIITGCTGAITETMESWEGYHQSELIEVWGPPTRTASDGRGGQVLIYETYVSTGQTPGTYGGGVYTNPTQTGYTRTRVFFVNASGYVYSWRWQGL